MNNTFICLCIVAVVVLALMMVSTTRREEAEKRIALQKTEEERRKKEDQIRQAKQKKEAEERDRSRRIDKAFCEQYHDPLEGYEIAYTYENVGVFVPDEQNFGEFMNCSVLIAEQDPDNPHDSRAVALVSVAEPLAYLYRGKLQDMANDYIGRGWPVYAFPTYAIPEQNRAEVRLRFYKPQ